MSREFTFDEIIMEPERFSSLAQSGRQDMYYVAALTVVALCNYTVSDENCHAMLDMIKNPAQPTSVYEKQFLRDRLRGKEYKPFSYFSGASPMNGYTPDEPYKITVESNPYSFTGEDRAVLYLRSGGADSPRQIGLRKKLSTGEWFLVEQFLLSDIRDPVRNEAGETVDPWG